MTEKRFASIGAYKIEDLVNNNVIDNIDDVEELLNKLSDENEQLKQFQDRVFCWIDMHLRMLPTARDNVNGEYGDPSLYSGAIQILETMKRELKGDVE